MSAIYKSLDENGARTWLSQKVFLKNKEGKFLALRRSATDPRRPLSWDLPGGMVEEGEHLEDSIKREIFEESGLQVTHVTYFAKDTRVLPNGEVSVQIAYIADAPDGDIVLSWEHDQYQWITQEDFLQLESSKRIKKFLGQLFS